MADSLSSPSSSSSSSVSLTQDKAAGAAATEVHHICQHLCNTPLHASVDHPFCSENSCFNISQAYISIDVHVQGTRASRNAVRIVLAPSIRSRTTDGIPINNPKEEGKPITHVSYACKARNSVTT